MESIAPLFLRQLFCAVAENIALSDAALGDKRLMACFQTVVRSVLLAGRRHEGASRLRLRRVNDG